MGAQGVAGPAGPPGATGATGPQGPAGTSPTLPTTTIASGFFTATSTTATLGASYGVSAVTRVSIGRYRLTFTTTQATTNFRALATAFHASTGYAVSTCAKTTTTVELCTRSLTAATAPLADPSEVSFDVQRAP